MDSGYACPRKMAAPCLRDAEPKAVINSPLATREPFGTPTSVGFPASARILRAADFRRAYNQGTRFTGRYFAAFCLRVERSAQKGRIKSDGPRLGFTVPRAFGKAVLRNRVKRRLREALRVRLSEMSPGMGYCDQSAATRNRGAGGGASTGSGSVGGAMQKAVIASLRLYKRFVSPVLPSACRFSPTCSEYMMEAVDRYGVLRGVGWDCAVCCAAIHSTWADSIRCARKFESWPTTNPN